MNANAITMPTSNLPHHERRDGRRANVDKLLARSPFAVFNDINLKVAKPEHQTLSSASRSASGSALASLLSDTPITHRRLKKGQHLFRLGDAFEYLYIINAGFVKTSYLSEDGREQTIGFHLRGDILGLDAVSSDAYSCDAVALDVCDLLAIPYDALIAQGQRNPLVVRELHRAFSYEIRSDRDLMLNLGSLPAEGRVAAFLLDLSARFGARGFSYTDLQLRLTRQEIGSLLGLQLETVSRAFSHFAKLGLIHVYLRDVTLLDCDGLRDIIAQRPQPMLGSRRPTLRAAA